ncbi:hypothetical protein AFE_2496 [Acidithiobacillus ferrooxidans ATCC 23270]|uniref:Uncharacterized protein n=1 Tax=Acidithiobacillus ferrooxidans (strain ATCC 23270 / DSM 14882 / CIP 104768 / NCIMB 8455) TaxID=243159 RepID=B7J731_ACIF2|nr:hypothetical protein AFE_2496 [Acidithiobacillus ferrooxidans ATCC 23270]
MSYSKLSLQHGIHHFAHRAFFFRAQVPDHMKGDPRVPQGEPTGHDAGTGPAADQAPFRDSRKPPQGIHRRLVQPVARFLQDDFMTHVNHRSAILAVVQAGSEQIAGQVDESGAHDGGITAHDRRNAQLRYGYRRTP